MANKPSLSDPAFWGVEDAHMVEEAERRESRRYRWSMAILSIGVLCALTIIVWVFRNNAW